MIIKPPFTIGISECLTGAKVRYDGAGKGQAYPFEALKDVFVLEPMCPEVGIGLPVPRPPIQLVRTVTGTRAIGVTDKAEDVTDQLENYGNIKRDHLCGFVFMERSPSCGLNSTKVHNLDGGVAMGLVRGIFARAFVACHPYLPCVEAQALWVEEQRNKFIEKVSIYSHWQAIKKTGLREADVQAFCARYQPLLAEKLLCGNPLGQLLSTLNQAALNPPGDAPD